MKGYLRPVGEWNYQEVTVDGDKLTVDVNGFEILNDEHRRGPRKAPGRQETPGRIADRRPYWLLGHNDPWRFAIFASSGYR